MNRQSQIPQNHCGEAKPHGAHPYAAGNYPNVHCPGTPGGTASHYSQSEPGQYKAPVPPARPPRMPRWAVALIVIGGLFAVVIGGCTALVSGADLATRTADDRTPIVSTEPGAPTSTYDPGINTPEPTKPAPKPAAKWVTLTTLHGSADKSSDTIRTTGGRVRLIYSVRGNEYVLAAFFLLDEGTDLMVDGGIPDVTVDKTSKDSTILRKAAGEYFLTAKVANGSYSVTVQEER